MSGRRERARGTAPRHLVRDLLDRTLVDSQGTPCGTVDDVELDGGAEALTIVALLVGPRARARRLPRWVRGLLSSPTDPEVRVPWDRVEEIGERIVLAGTAKSLGLGEGDRAAARWVRRMPGA